jgi:hypothetical protein
MSVGKDKGTKWGKKRTAPHAGTPKDRTKAKAQPRLKGYKQRKRR